MNGKQWKPYGILEGSYLWRRKTEDGEYRYYWTPDGKAPNRYVLGWGATNARLTGIIKNPDFVYKTYERT